MDSIVNIKKCILYIAGVFLLVFISSCTQKDDRVIAIVNGKQIKIKNLKEKVDPKNWNKDYLVGYLNHVIEKEIILYEANRLSIPEDELFLFFNSLKNRKISDSEYSLAQRAEFKDFKKETRKFIEDKIREKQYETAKKAYIQELKNRSTVRLYLNQLDKGL